MPIIEWNGTYELGIDRIDEHHQHLFALLNSTYDAFVGNGQKVEVDAIIEELINYATYHFSAEEDFMSRHDYKDISAHLRLHEDFIQKIKIFQQEFMDGRKTLSLELIVFLKEWLQEHILKTDRAYADLIGSSREGLVLSLV